MYNLEKTTRVFILMYFTIYLSFRLIHPGVFKLSRQKKTSRTDGWTDRRTDGQTDALTDRTKTYMPPARWAEA